jgi:hypothetical protein
MFHQGEATTCAINPELILKSEMEPGLFGFGTPAFSFFGHQVFRTGSDGSRTFDPFGQGVIEQVNAG